MSGKKVKEYDVIVVGSGSGATIVDSALHRGLSVAWVDRGPLGGTCLNVGCIPSKILIFPADRVMEIREAGKLGVDAEIKNIDFGAILARMRRMVGQSRDHIREGLHSVPNLDFYEVEGHFVEDEGLERPRRTLTVGDQRISGRHVFLVSGARPYIPPIEGLEDVQYLTNETVLDLTERPESLAITGGGYISAEYAHFFSAMGTRVTILQRNDRLVPDEEPEISELLERKFSERMDVYTHTEVTEAVETDAGITLIAGGLREGEQVQVVAERVMVAAGRQSNADILQVENAGIETDDWGYIKVNRYLETNVEDVWALGDATGKH
ncbi:MAG: FAD-dependent oxidoreductase, partial [Chloroflexota bacterium]|nr:FAD-dependent oxidoreductase [Chloroflexota bacterium]